MPALVGVIQLSGMFSMGMFDVTSLEKPAEKEIQIKLLIKHINFINVLINKIYSVIYYTCSNTKTTNKTIRPKCTIIFL